MADGPLATRPARGTRPSNRRELIVAAAADLFYRNGYASVSMSNIADAVAMGPSALYRHFRNKETLLATVVGNAVAELEDALAAALDDSSGTAAVTLASLSLRNRAAGVLWQREGRYLSVETRSELRVRARAVGNRIAALIRRQRPEVDETQAELLAWSALAVAQSISYHRLQLPAAEFAATLTALVDASIAVEIPRLEASPANESRPALRSSTRRETILTEAAILFGEQGYSNVSMEDIGNAVGATGPSLYNHFVGKSDILIAVMMRGAEWLQMDLNRSLSRATDPRDALIRLLESYATFVFDNPHLMQLLSTELLELSEADQERTRSAQLAYISEWVHLLNQVHPEWDTTRARIRIQAVHTMMSHIALTPHLRRFGNADSVVMDIGAALLEVA
ncbi:TetR/AcrR family transcriptional regulator [Smaragdicoccus niigatensis]|uniref:TetR/AcrR family transcriptional regulator n=1 Tax=Smaragdicoccus niigatensis TaxID=359359 RepID=UPI000370D89D|nr:TetR/AcrR family transcriptional regulator [Smaragdicoccus niigatensis]